MSVYDATDMAKALPAIDSDPSTEGNTAKSKAIITNDGATQDLKRDPQAYGWAQKQSYDYDEYNRTNKETAEEAGVEGAPSSRDWASNAAKYEWSDDYGDVGPAFPELEKQLFGSEFHVQATGSFDYLKSIHVYQEGTVQIQPVREFADAGLHPVMLQNVKLCGYDAPTPVQAYCMPAILKGYDIVACAQTGSGKTAAFLIPTLSKLMGKAKKLAAPRPNPAMFREGIDPPVRAEPLLLVICPSRELATQIFDEARRFCYRSMLRPCVVYGGGPVGDQIKQLQKGCDVLIATPGRLCDMINRPRVLSLHRLKYTIIDEADEMLDADWDVELKKIMSGGDQQEGSITYMMFSATFPKAARDLAKEYLALDHVRIRIGRAGSSHINIKQNVVWVEPSVKREALVDLLYATPPARTMIFVNTRKVADEVDDWLFNLDMPCTSIHADRTQREREDALRAFRTGKTPILVATGVSARGLDMRSVMHIMNYDLPSSQYGGITEYIHRIGRTGRIGNLGIATSFFNDHDADIAEELTKTLMETGQEIPDFLEQYKPDLGKDGKLRFAADSDFDETENVEADAAGAADGGWEVDAPGDTNIPGAADASAPVDGGWGADDETEPPIAATPAVVPTATSAVAHVVAPIVAPVAAPVAARAEVPTRAPAKTSWGVEIDPVIVQKASGWNNLAEDRAAFAPGWEAHAKGSAPKSRAKSSEYAAPAAPAAPASPTTGWEPSW